MKLLLTVVVLLLSLFCFSVFFCVYLFFSRARFVIGLWAVKLACK
jgi:hypothetical protein